MRSAGIALEATVGSRFLAGAVDCAAAGWGTGSLTGAAAPAGIVASFAGLVAGFALVHARVEDI
jgi:hypothetical protein